MQRCTVRVALAGLGVVGALAAGCGASDASGTADAGGGGSGGAAGGGGAGGGGGGGGYVPPDQQTVCARTVPESVAPALACTPKKAGTPAYDGCTPNTPCGPLLGCPLEKYEPAEPKIVETTYTPAPAGYTPPPRLLPAVGTTMTGRATGWFRRVDRVKNQGSCSFPPIRNLSGVALATVSYGNADWCGACAEVTGTSGKRVRVVIVDQCTGCAPQSLDIPAGEDTPLGHIVDQDFRTAYQCPGYDGTEPITWKIVPCEAEGGLRVSYVEGYNKWLPALRLSNHRLPIATLEEQVAGAWKVVRREVDNKFILSTRTTNTGDPIVIRVTAMDGAQITGTFPVFEPGKLYEAKSQF